MKLLKLIVHVILWPFLWLYRLIFATPPEFNNPTDGQCVTWDGSGNVTIPVGFTAPLPTGYSYVITVFQGSTQYNGDYSFVPTMSVNILSTQFTAPKDCVTLTLSLYQINNAVSPPVRKYMCPVTVNLCPKCAGKPVGGEG